MRRAICTILLVFVFSIVLVTSAVTEPLMFEFNPDSAVVLGASTATTATQKIASKTFSLPWASPIYITVSVTDSGAGNGASTDSLAVTLQKGFDYQSTDDYIDEDSLWIDVKTLAAFDPTKTFDIHHYMSKDSVTTGPYQIGGVHRLLLHKGGGQTLDTVSGDYTVRVFIEYEGRD